MLAHVEIRKLGTKWVCCVWDADAAQWGNTCVYSDRVGSQPEALVAAAKLWREKVLCVLG
jgi:hypothetical protein